MPKVSTKTGTSGVDNFEISLVSDIRGYYSSIDPTLAPENVLVRGSQNVYKTASGTWANRPGRKQYDAIDSTLAGVKAAYVWNTFYGKALPIRIANGKLQVLSDIVTSGTFVWYDLLTSLTNTRGVFVPWWDNTNKKDKLLIVTGATNTIYDWSGGISNVASGTLNTITKSGTTTWAQVGFAPTGTVTIGGVDYTYTGGTNTTTLTGVTPDASGLTTSVGIQKIVTVSIPASGFACDFINVIGNQLFVGSYSSRFIYVSSSTDYTNFTVPTPRLAGSPDLITLDGLGKAITARQNEAYFSAGTNFWYRRSLQNITVASVLQEQATVEPLPVTPGAAALAHEMVDVVGDTIVYLSQDQQLRTVGTARNLTTPAFPTLSEEVSTDLFNEDFTLGQLKAIAGGDKGDLIYITAPNSGITYIYQLKQAINRLGNIVAERLWFSPFVWGLSRIDFAGTTTLGFSNSNPQTYTLWDTGQWHDDGASNSTAIQLSYTSILLMSYRSHNRRQGKFKFDKFYWEGYMTQGTALYGTIYYDYQGSTLIAAPIIHSIVDNSPANDQSFFSGVTPPSLGDASLGDNPLGDVTAVINFNTTIRDRDLVPKFKIITDVELKGCYEYAPMIFTSHADDRWELIALGPNVSLSGFQAVELRK